MTVRFSRFLEGQRVIRHPQNPEKPLVSVIMPTYILRPGGLNQRAIESVLGQSFADFEFIIIDDGSIDGLHQVLLEYQHCDPRIVLVRHEVNSGLHATRVNEGLLLAKGKYIACMFEDDEWQPKGLAQLVETMLQAPGECVVYGAVEWIVHRSDGSTERRTLGEWDFNYASLKNQNKIAHCAVLHPRSLLASSRAPQAFM
jgi:glycosyltransferase involved in cell wall biosynthesis